MEDLEPGRLHRAFGVVRPRRRRCPAPPARRGRAAPRTGRPRDRGRRRARARAGQRRAERRAADARIRGGGCARARAARAAARTAAGRSAPCSCCGCRDLQIVEAKRWRGEHGRRRLSQPPTGTPDLNECSNCTRLAASAARQLVRQPASAGGGWKPPNSRSTSRAIASVVRSSRYGPAIWSPTGRPSRVRPIGTTVAGR